MRVLRDGTEGNQRLTATTALVLLLLLAAEGATIPFIRPLFSAHVFIGLLLLPIVAVKLGAVAWRFFRYYTRDPRYVALGPPNTLLRFLVAPIVVASTVVLFATGTLLVVLNPQRGLLLGLHKASFIVWFGSMTAHVLGHLLKVPGLARAELAFPTRASWLRQATVAGALVIGLVFGVAGLPAAHTWAQWALVHGHDSH